MYSYYNKYKPTMYRFFKIYSVSISSHIHPASTTLAIIPASVANKAPASV